jgi:hypothetical protein
MAIAGVIIPILVTVPIRMIRIVAFIFRKRDVSIPKISFQVGMVCVDSFITNYNIDTTTCVPFIVGYLGIDPVKSPRENLVREVVKWLIELLLFDISDMWIVLERFKRLFGPATEDGLADLFNIDDLSHFRRSAFRDTNVPGCSTDSTLFRLAGGYLFSTEDTERANTSGCLEEVSSTERRIVIRFCVP